TRSKKAGKKSYHLACFQCVACRKGFRGGDRFQVDQWGNLGHLQHQSLTYDCGSCGRMFARRGVSRDLVLADGRVACRVCRDDAVFELEELNSIRNEVDLILESVGIARPVGSVEMKLVSRRELSNEAKRIHVGGNLKGLTVSKFRQVTFKGKTEVTFAHVVYVLFGLPKSELRSVISHEMMHVWLNEREVGAPADVIEGFCNLGSDQVLRQDPSRLAWILIDNMKTNTSPTYGGGYRKMMAHLNKIGWPRMIAEMDARGKKH
ncbi:MAG: protein DA1, partial [Opitutales bacterium]